MQAATKKNRSKRKPRRRPRVQGGGSGESLRFLQPAPDSILVPLRYVDPSWIAGNTGATYWSRRFTMNSAYDPDTALGGGSLMYYYEYALLYKRYRVVKFAYNIEFVNQTNSTVVASIAPTKDDYGANYLNSIDFGETVGGKSHSVAPVGGMNRCLFRGVVDLTCFSGHKGYLYDDVTSALVTSSPNQLYYFNVAGNTSAIQTSSSFGVRCSFVYLTLFFDRVSPFDTQSRMLLTIARLSELELKRSSKKSEIEALARLRQSSPNISRSAIDFGTEELGGE